jgi:hypothetical protein
MKRFRVIALILSGVFAVPTLNAGSPDPLFQDDAALQVEITAPFSRLINERPKDRELQGSFSFFNSDGTTKVLDIQVRARGKFRHANCDFPPLFLNFKRSQVEATLFDRQNKLKMVVHCKDSGRYQESVLREYLAYRILNSVTDLSFQVRLLNVTYVDSENRRPRMVRSAFLIEHENRLADRLDMQRQNIFPEKIEDIQADHLNLTSIFQFLIGNTDFSAILGSKDECCHNYSLFGTGDSSLLAIPYDFDMSGFVHTPYARPPEDLDIDDVRQRRYQGFCVNNRYVEASISEFLQARATLYDLVENQRALQESVRQRLAAYLDEFYQTVGDSQGVEREILNRCIDMTGAG